MSQEIVYVREKGGVIVLLIGLFAGMGLGFLLATLLQGM